MANRLRIRIPAIAKGNPHMRSLVLAAAGALFLAGAALAQPAAPSAGPPPRPPRVFAQAGYAEPDIPASACKTASAAETPCTLPAMTAGRYFAARRRHLDGHRGGRGAADHHRGRRPDLHQHLCAGPEDALGAPAPSARSTRAASSPSSPTRRWPSPRSISTPRRPRIRPARAAGVPAAMDRRAQRAAGRRSSSDAQRAGIV